MDRTRSTGQRTVFDSFVDASEDQLHSVPGVPVEWRDAHRERARSRLAQRLVELLSEDHGLIESKLFRVEMARHALTHAQASELHADLDPGPALRVTRATRHPAGTVQLPWPDPLTTADVKARRDRAVREARRLRHRLEVKLGYALLTRNCVTELLAALDAALSIDPETAAFGGDRLDDREALLTFIPVVAERIARRHLAVTESGRLPSWRETALGSEPSRGLEHWVERIRESNTLSSRTYRPHAGDSVFLLFSPRSAWLRPLAGIANLATGLGTVAIGALTAPFDRARMARRGLQGVVMSIPELFFFNIRKGSYVIEPPMEVGNPAVGAFEQDGT
jgi:hypothetical protein